MNLNAIPTVLAVIAAAVGAGVGPGTGVADAASARAADDGRRGGVVLRVRQTPFGKVIHEKRSGLAAYLFTRERRGGKPRCYGDCANAWPPVKAKGRPIAGAGLDQERLGTVERRGGGRMVTYDGRPLYFYVADSPGTILCNDVFEFGGDWFVIGPDGEPASG